MKKLAVTLLLALFVTASFAATFAVAIQEKTKIEMDAVPEVVKDAFVEKYDAEAVNVIYSVPTDEGVNYEFVVTIEEIKWAIVFDSAGTEISKTKVEDETEE
mgnify:CR=1 FL=1|tara:strand:- start:269 stop:574 length:306 start_codon:yes stop_codon:yes gene_type:complete